MFSREIPPGTYTVQFELTGFKNNVAKGIIVDVNQVMTLNSALQIGGYQEIGRSELPNRRMVDTTSTQLGAVMDARAGLELPLNSRDTYQLLQLQPGVQGSRAAATDPVLWSNTRGRGFGEWRTTGAPTTSVSTAATERSVRQWPAIQPSPDSIAEFRVITNTFDAEYGRNSGAVINVVTKSGTNQLHGSFYEFFRNDVLDSKGFLDPATPDNKQNQFGGTIRRSHQEGPHFFLCLL